MEANRTSTKADSLTRSAATRRKPARPSKLALLRVKVVTIVVSVILFLASLAGIAILNPRVATSQSPAVTPVPTQRITIVGPGTSNSPVVLPPPSSLSGVRPFVRSRGS